MGEIRSRAIHGCVCSFVRLISSLVFREYDRVGGFVSLSLSLSAEQRQQQQQLSNGKEESCANFRSGKIEKKRDLAGKKKSKAAKARESLFLSPESSPEDAKMRRRRERAFFFWVGGSRCAAVFVYRAVSLSLSLSLTVHSHICFSLFSAFFFPFCRRG